MMTIGEIEQFIAQLTYLKNKKKFTKEDFSDAQDCINRLRCWLVNEEAAIITRELERTSR